MSAQANLVVAKPASEWMAYVHDSLHEVFDMMLGMKVAPCEGSVPAPELTAIVGLAGSLCGLFIIRCSKETGHTLASKMLGTDDCCEDQVLDALGEICNMLAGSFKSRIPGIADTCMLSVPTSIAGEDYRVHALSGGKQFEILAQCEDDSLQIILHVNC
jgi:chemotaxis protein CheX